MRARRCLSPIPLLLLAACTVTGPVEPLPEPVRTRLIFGGDVMLSRHVGRLARLKKDPAFPFRDLAAVTTSADIAFANLEAPFSDRGPHFQQGMMFKAAPEMIAGLKLAGISLVSTANNHARDCGAYGLEYTLKWTAANGIAATGTGATGAAAHGGAVLERHGLRFGFLAYTYDQSNGNHPAADDRVAMLDVAAMRGDVQSLARRADVIVVSMHAGTEYSPTPARQQIEFARSAIDAGASVVVGHHPHVVQPAERYRQGVIFYSLGNLVFDQFHRRETQHGLLAEVTFRGRAIEKYTLWPVAIRNTVPTLGR